MAVRLGVLGVGRSISFYPITRIEGHAKVTIVLGDDGEVESAYFHVMEFRGFEAFLRNRPVEEAPIIVTRICGLCSTSHHLASVKAVDSILGLEVSPWAEKLRLALHLAGIVHSHALHFFLLYAPDLLLSDLPVWRRGLPELAKRYPRLIRNALAIRRFAQRVLEALGGSSVHPTAAVPGGFAKPIEGDERLKLLEACNEAMKIFSETLSLVEEAAVKSAVGGVSEPSNFLSLYSDEDFALYDAPKIRAISERGDLVDEFRPEEYLEHINERVVSWSYAKAPFLKKLGYPDGIYRVGPLARLNIAGKLNSDWAEDLREKFNLSSSRPVNSTRHYNLARLVELAYCFERLNSLLSDSSLERAEGPARRVRVEFHEGVGVVEAPRGTLIHHYFADDEGIITRANMIVATVQNIPVIGRDVKVVASKILKGSSEERLLAEVSTLIRDYDPCLSCSVHCMNVPVVIEVLNSSGEVVARLPKEL